jgi:hypothetical protein
VTVAVAVGLLVFILLAVVFCRYPAPHAATINSWNVTVPVCEDRSTGEMNLPLNGKYLN